MHKLLQRQLQQFFGADSVPAELAPFLAAVSEAYAAADQERTLLERSLGITSQALLTRNKQLQRELANESRSRQTQKMEAIARLAGGLTHDFNNLLVVISGYAALLDGALATAEAPLRSHVGEIQRATDRAAALTRQLLAFSRQQVLQQRAVDLNALLAGMQAPLERIVGEDIRLVFAPATGLGHVLGDAAQLEQVLVNLVMNARDAMPHGGTLTLETANSRLAGREGEGGDDSAVAAGDYVRFTVSDNGAGMDAATRSRAFEPFFTTKEAGKGTGLGLATVYGVVKQSGGHVWLESAPQQGCAVHVHLPRIEPPAPQPGALAQHLPKALGEQA